MAWLEGWTRRQQVLITVNPGETVRIDVEYLSDYMNAGLTDVRFTYSDGTTLIDFAWLSNPGGVSPGEEGTGQISMPVSFPISYYFWMYYGKVDATSLLPVCAQGGNDFCDDFNDESIDLLKWTTQNGVTEEAGVGADAGIGYLKIPHALNSIDWPAFLSIGDLAPGQLLQMKIKFGSSTGPYRLSFFGFSEDIGGSGNACYLRCCQNSIDKICARTGSEIETHDVTASVSTDEWIYLSIHWKTNGTFVVEINNVVEFISSAFAVLNTDMRVTGSNHQQIGFAVDYDDYIDYVVLNETGDEILEVEPSSVIQTIDDYNSCVRWGNYLYELKHAVNYSEKNVKFPDELLKMWTIKDMDETALWLGGLVNQRYRKTAVISVPGAAGATFSGVAHSSGATEVTGFTGLTVNEYANCAISYVGDSVFYSAGIESNTIDTLVLTDGNDLPIITSGIIIVTKAIAGGEIDLSSLRGYENGDKIWSVVDANGKPIPKTSTDLSKNIANMPYYDGVVMWYQLGDKLKVIVGTDTVWSGMVSIGYYRLPYEIVDEDSCIDFPISYQYLVQLRTQIRMLIKLGFTQEAEYDARRLNALFLMIQRGVMSMKNIDWVFKERVS